jgi:hypothetical protein
MNSVKLKARDKGLLKAKNLKILCVPLVSAYKKEPPKVWKSNFQSNLR